MAKRHADAETAEGAGVHIGRRLQAGAREAQQIAAVGDADIVRRRHRGDGVEDRARMHLAVGAGRGLFLARRLGHARAVALPHAVGPGLVERGLAVTGRVHHGGQRQVRRCQQFGLATAVVDQLAGIIRDPDEAGVRKHGRRPVGHLVVELAADQQNDIGLAHRRRTHRRHRRWMFGRHQAAAFLRVEIERAGGVEQAHERRAAPARAAAGDDQRPLGAPERVDRRGDSRRIGGQSPRRLVLHPFVEHELRRHRRAQHVGGYFDIDRPRLTGVTHGAGDGLVQFADHLIGHAQRARRAADRAQQIDMRNILQWPHIGLRPRRAAADQQHRRARERGIGHRGHRVGDARTGGDHGDAEAACQLRMRVRHVHRGAFVAHVDDADALARDVVPDRLDMPALQAEDAIDPADLEKARDPGRA